MKNEVRDKSTNKIEVGSAVAVPENLICTGSRENKNADHMPDLILSKYT